MKKGLLLINLGTPDAPEKDLVRSYLREFLSDPLVIDLPAPLRWLLLHGVILPFRTAKTTKAYQHIWTEKGSPLLVNSLNLCERLQTEAGKSVRVVLGMRYGKPSIEAALEALKDCEQVTVIPLYPQYSTAATGSSIERTLKLIKGKRPMSSLHIVKHFFDNKSYIEAQAERIRPLLKEVDALLLSYHGLPEMQLKKSGCRIICQTPCTPSNFNCYRAQCFATSRLLAKALKLPEDKVITTFQSRVGKAKWVQPYTTETLDALAAKGIKHLAIACPGFVADCLETLEEIGMRAKDQWLRAGGETFALAPCVNDSDLFVKALLELLD